MTIDLLIDESGCIRLPAEVMTELGVSPQSHVLLDVSPLRAVIRPCATMTPQTHFISSLNLPVGEWSEMKAEIIAAR
jgi:hypothetical protein